MIQKPLLWVEVGKSACVLVGICDQSLSLFARYVPQCPSLLERARRPWAGIFVACQIGPLLLRTKSKVLKYYTTMALETLSPFTGIFNGVEKTILLIGPECFARAALANALTKNCEKFVRMGA
jgi:hypothetical protein